MTFSITQLTTTIHDTRRELENISALEKLGSFPGNDNLWVNCYGVYWDLVFRYLYKFLSPRHCYETIFMVKVYKRNMWYEIICGGD